MLWFALAENLGGRTVREWKEAMDSAEFQTWMTWYSLPFRVRLLAPIGRVVCHVKNAES